MGADEISIGQEMGPLDVSVSVRPPFSRLPSLENCEALVGGHRENENQCNIVSMAVKGRVSLCEEEEKRVADGGREKS